MKYIWLTLCMVLCVTIGIAHADYDETMPNGAAENPGSSNPKPLSPLTPPIIGQFASPDGATRGLGFDGVNLWAANSGDGNSQYGPQFYKLDPDNGSVINSFASLGGSPAGITFDGGYLWVAEYGSNQIHKVDTGTFAVQKSFSAPASLPFDLAWDGQYIFIAFGNTPAIVYVDTGSGAQQGTVPVTYSSGNVRPFGLTMFPSFNLQLWTSDGNYGSNMVNVWDFVETAWVDQWAGTGADYPCGLAYDAVGQRVWIGDWAKDSIWIYDVSGMGVGSNGPENIDEYSIQVCPNPFTDVTRIRYQSSNDQSAGLEIYDASGRLVKCFEQSHVIWNGTNEHGDRLATGIYFVRDTMNGQTVKIVKLK